MSPTDDNGLPIEEDTATPDGTWTQPPRRRTITASAATDDRPRPLSTLLGSARRLTTQDIAKTARGASRRKKAAEREWQDTAREMYRSVGEYRFIVDMVSGKVGAAKLYVGKLSTEDPANDPEQVTDEPDVVEVLNSLGGTFAGRSQLLTRLSVNLMVVGDGWIVGLPPHIVDPENNERPQPGTAIPLESLDWRFMSIKEVEVGQSDVKLRLDNMSEPRKVSPEQVYMIRVWDPDPFEWWEAAASSRANLPVLKELVGLTMHISAQVDSRLAGAGVFLVPETAQRALQAAAGIEEGVAVDQFTDALVEAMLTPIGDRGSASAIVPLVVTAPDESIEKFRHIKFSSELDAEARELREEAIRRLALGMDAPPEVLLGTSAANHWGCVDPDTRILTRDGWRSHDQLSAGDSVLTLNHETGMAEWHPVETVHRWEVENAPVLRLDTAGHESWTTLDHRWPVVGVDGERSWTTSEYLEPGMQVVTAAGGAAAQVETVPDGLVELAAWFLMRGDGNDRDRRVRWLEGGPRLVQAVRAVFGDEFHQLSSGGVQLRAAAARRFAEKVLDGRLSERRVSARFLAGLSQHQLDLFVAACEEVSADRHGPSVSGVDVWLGNRDRLEPVALAGVLAGYSVRWSRPEPGGDWCVSVGRGDVVDPLAGGVEVLPYTGTIWCPQVENRSWLARRGDSVFFTGNSWMVSADTIQSHVEPKLALICDALTTQYLWPVLKEQEVEDAEDYVVWYDVAHLITRPNRSQDALALHEKKVISDPALRREMGFDEDDAPEEDDPVVSTILGMAQSNPGMLRSPALPQMVDVLRAILGGDWDALAAATEKKEPVGAAAAAAAPPGGVAAPDVAGPAGGGEAASGEAPVEGVAPVSPAGPAGPTEPTPVSGAPRLPSSVALPVQGVQRAPVG